MDRFFIYGKPRIRDVRPYALTVYNPGLTATQDFRIALRGGYFWNIRNVYLSASNVGMFNGLTYFNPFSANPRLSATNPGFSAYPVFQFIYNQASLVFELPQVPNASGQLEVIVENEAGYSLLTRDSRTPFVSAYKGAVDMQLPCVNGITVIDLPDTISYFEIYGLDDLGALENIVDSPNGIAILGTEYV